MDRGMCLWCTKRTSLNGFEGAPSARSDYPGGRISPSIISLGQIPGTDPSRNFTYGNIWAQFEDGSIKRLVNFASRIYVGKLMMLRARTAYALVEREQTIELYRLFTGVQENQIEVDKLAIQRANAAAVGA